MQVLSPIEQLADPHLNERGAFVTLEHPLAGLSRFEGLPFRFRRTPVVPERRAPLLGEHTDDVLREWLGQRAEVG
jgi:crotonobetainyl-CoA:carnitine CoA-transferase CaiB-like acyl-CoA transferase